MSDFDKEAEREKLREKYDQEQTEREATEKMSELLLQGATMTNAHCSDCGDPIFRYEGQEFCATCEKAVERDTDAEGDADDSTAEGEDTENIEVTNPDDGARVAFGGENVGDAEANGDRSPTPDEAAADAGQSTPDPARQSPTAPEPDTAGDERPPRQPSTQQRQPTHEVPSVEPAESAESADVSAARDSLVRTLTRFSQQAEATDDPRRAQEYLAAARKAAETLAALRQ